MDIPAPALPLVVAARQHLSKRYAAGVDQVLWDAEKRPMPDSAAVRAVINAGSRAEPLDMASALVLVQVIRQGVDVLEYELFEAVRTAGITDTAVAAVLGLSDEAAARARRQWLSDRQTVPPDPPGQLEARAPGRARARPGRRAGVRAPAGTRPGASQQEPQAAASG
jgi:hypothetical protein